MKLILIKVLGLKSKNLTRHKAKRLQVIIEKDPPTTSYPFDSAPCSRRKNATPGGVASLIDPPSPPTKAKVKKLNWFKRTLLCVQVEIHKENYDSYVQQKHIVHNQGVILKELEALSGKGKSPKAVDDSSDESAESDATIPYHEWRC